jgi:hypothetical protein
MDKKQRFKRLIQVGIAGGVAVVVAPTIFLVIQGLIGLIAAFVVGSVALALQPAFSTWLTNLKYKAVKEVVERDPCATLIAQRQERAQALEDARGMLEQQVAAVELFSQKTKKLVKQYPEEAEESMQTLKEYEALLVFRVDQFKDSREKHAAFSRNVDKYIAKYELAQLGNATGKALNSGSDVMAKFKESIAFDKIDREHAQSLAHLRMALTDESYAKEQIKTSTSTHQVTYTPDGRVQLGSILEPVKELA